VPPEARYPAAMSTAARQLGLLTVAVTAAAVATPSQRSLDDLVAADWRARNVAARALAALPDASFPIVPLVELLRTTWQGPELGLTGGLGGRAIGRSVVDPRRDVLVAARNELVSGWRRTAGGPDGHDVRTVERLVAPWHPHALAFWLLSSRPAIAARVAAHMQQVPLVTPPLARLWARTAAPSLTDVQRRADDGSDLDAAALALWHEPENGRPRLLDVLADGPVGWRRAAIRLGDVGLLATAAARGQAIDAFLREDDDAARRQAGWLLLELRAPASGLLRAHLGTGAPATAEDDRRLLGLTCLLEEHARGLGEELAPFVAGEDAVARDRALCALGAGEVVAAARPRLAEAALAVLLGGAPTRSKALALDALANLGDGVGADLRARLVQMLDEPPFRGAAPRVFGALHRLGAAPQVDASRVLAWARADHGTLHTWLAAAADPRIDAVALVEALTAGRNYDLRDRVLVRLAQESPGVLERAIANGSTRARQHPIRALTAARTVSMPVPALLPLLDDPELRVATFGLLATHPDADALAAAADALLAAVTAVAADWVPSEGNALLDRLALPAPRLFDVFEPLLRTGRSWALVRGADRDAVGKAARAWLAAATHDGDRARLLGVVAGLGMQDDDEHVAPARTALRGAHAEDLLDALLRAPRVPAALRPELEALVDAGFEPVASPETSAAAARAADVLLAHFAR
jgi:hypothetical protein